MKLSLLACPGLAVILVLGASTVWSQDVPHEKVTFDCETCHTTASFTEVSFDHAGLAGFALEGRHGTVDCRSCHTLKDFSIAAKDCQSCHTDVHEARLGQDCSRCHSASGWQVLDAVTIHEHTDFPVMGRHALVDCESCHRNFPKGDLSHTDARCVICHQSDYLEVSNPNHVGAGFSTDCEICHQMNAFRPALLPDHDVFFPIYSGEHRGEWNSCNTCHVDPNNFADFTCLSCHAHQQSSMDEEHSGIPGYAYNSPDCYLCHPRGEAESFTDHDASFFPIFSGPHQGEWAECSTCHTVPSDRRFVDCLGCHEHRQSEMDGRHGAMTGYSYTSSACLECHPDGEKGIFTAHDAEFFPIFSGPHSGQWQDCATCHTVVSDRSVFDCLSCHEATITDPIHDGMTGYVYASSACYDCHPTGEGGEFIAHDAEFFPIFSGEHQGVWDECSACHTAPLDRTVFNCLSCHEHRQEAMDGQHGSMTGYAYTSAACYDCHPTGDKGTFTAHDAEFFPIFSGRHNNEWADCATCHDVPLDRSRFTCFNCHEHDQTRMDDQHLGEVSNYVYSSDACYECHPDGQSD